MRNISRITSYATIAQNYSRGMYVNEKKKRTKYKFVRRETLSFLFIRALHITFSPKEGKRA